MPSDFLAVESARDKAKLLIVCFRSSEGEARWQLAKHAHKDWEADGRIRIVSRNDNFGRYRAENSQELNKWALKSEAARVVLLGKIEHQEKFGEGRDLRSVNVFTDMRSFEHGLPAILRQSGLDWRTFITARLRAWIHSVIDEVRVEQWLDQFRRLGVPWIGEHLLRTLDFWAPERLKAALGLNEECLRQFDCLCLKRQQAGKSADFLGNLLRKHLNSLVPSCHILDFETVLNQPDEEPRRKILFIEDALLTGTEMTNFLSGLLGIQARPGRYWPVAKLHWPERLSNSQIEFRFPVSTSLGIQRFRNFLTEYKLTNARVFPCPNGFIEVLTSAGQEALDRGAFYDPVISNCPVTPDAHLERAAFRVIWRNESQRSQAEAFCRDAGRQLFAEYLRRKNWQWDPKKISVASFGMHGLGLNLAFSHSVPKASLPLLWAEGKVEIRGAKVDWNPLFANAEI